MRALLFLSAAATSVAATLNAQVATDSASRSKVFYRMDSAMANRAAIGLSLRATGTRRDTLGVFVDAVTPKGPAETAGIIEGDRIAAINGVDLRTASGDVDDSYTNGLAAHRLSREVQKLTPGTRVTLRVYSGGRFRDVQVTTGKASDVMRLSGSFNFRMPGSDGMMEFNGLPNKIQLRSPMRFKTLSPTRVPRVFKVEAGEEGELGPVWIGEGDEDPIMPDMEDESFDIENEIEGVPPAVIRDLAANAIRDARSALKQLAADGVA